MRNVREQWLQVWQRPGGEGGMLVRRADREELAGIRGDLDGEGQLAAAEPLRGAARCRALNVPGYSTR